MSLSAAGQREVAKYSKVVADLFGVRQVTSPTVQIVNPNDPNLGGGFASVDTANNIIYINNQWNPKDIGAVLHELTHTYAMDANHSGDTKWTDALADAVRYIIDPKKGKSGEPNWTPSDKAMQIIKQYQANPNSLGNIREAMISGTFHPAAVSNGVYQKGTGTNQATGGGQNVSGGPTAGDTGTGGAGGGGRRTGSQYHGDPGTQTGGGAGTTGGGSTSSTPPPGSTPPKGMTWGKLPDGTYGWVPKTGPGGGNGTGTQDQTKNNVATFTTMVQGWGIDPSGNITNLIQTAASKGWNVARFTQAVSQTPEFQQRFPGIFNDAGGLKMTPAAYMQQEKSYQNVAAQSGLNIGPGRMAYLFRNDVSPTEFQTRASAIAKIRDNADMFKSFSQQLAAEGLAPKGGLSKQDLFKFVLGEGNSQWYQSYNNTLSRYYGQQSGITFGHAPNKSYTDLNAKTVEKIGQKGLSEADLQSGYSKLASDLTTAMPLSKIQKFGLTKQDLVELEFGGPKQAAVAQKVQMLLKNEANVESSTNKAYLGANPALTQARTQQERAQV